MNYLKACTVRNQVIGVEVLIDENSISILTDDAKFEIEELTRKIGDILLVNYNNKNNPEVMDIVKLENTKLLACFPKTAIYRNYFDRDGSKTDKEFPGIISFREIPNGYCSQACCKHKPWLEVYTIFGYIIIGWRKRVIEIIWKDTNLKKSHELFADEDVTKDDKLIHAWGYDKAKEYLAKLLEIEHANS